MTVNCVLRKTLCEKKGPPRRAAQILLRLHRNRQLRIAIERFSRLANSTQAA
jgi:hypothetical protein